MVWIKLAMVRSSSTMSTLYLLFPISAVLHIQSEAELCAAFAPTVNSYKRLVRQGAMAGFSWAPVFNSYGSNNRTNSVRVPAGGGRCESRNADGAVNPYLAAALVLAAGLEGVREASIDINGLTVNVAMASGMRSAKVLLDDIRAGKSKYHFIEIMGCPGGCINGGGQPYVRTAFLPNEDDDIYDTYIQKRARALYSEDERQVIRQSHNNPHIKALYAEFLGEPNSHKAHELLHTTYSARVGFND